MLLNYNSNKMYDIDINNILKFYSSFAKEEITKKYINSWCSALNTAYVNNVPVIKSYDRPSYFQQRIIIPNIDEFYIHFDVNTAIKKSSRFTSNNINAVELLRNGVDYTKCYDLNKYHFVCQEPIIIVPFPMSTTKPYLVIDGNHRVSAMLENNSRINFVSFDYATTLTTIPQTFDQTWYMFLIETTVFNNLKNEHDRNNLYINSYAHKLSK